jgi:hypothetical protein
VGKSMQEQLQKIRCEVRLLKYNEETRTNNVQIRRWVVWRKDGKEFKKVCVYDSSREVCDD